MQKLLVVLLLPHDTRWMLLLFHFCDRCVCVSVVAVLNVAATALSVRLLWFCAAFFSSFDDVDYFNSAKVKAQPTTVTPGPEFLFYRLFSFFTCGSWSCLWLRSHCFSISFHFSFTHTSRHSIVRSCVARISQARSSHHHSFSLTLSP